MTGEEAIKWFENAVPKNCSECSKELDFSVGGWVSKCNHADSLRCEAYAIARAALREQEERSKGCEYCAAPVFVKIQQFAKPILAPATPVQELEYKLLDMTGETYVKAPKRFCPMCGRKLVEIDQFNRVKIDTVQEVEG